MSDEAVPRPSHGGRLQAKLVATNDGGAVYQLALADTLASFSGGARVLESDGAVTFDAWPLEPPAWLVEGARVLLRAAWQRHRSGQGWPRRLARWRPGPESEA
jgi:hypothetical protein